MCDERAYLARRIDEEIAAAEKATCLEAALAHRKLAFCFMQKARAMDSRNNQVTSSGTEHSAFFEQRLATDEAENLNPKISA